jgi:hypothetical protein
MRAIPPTAKQVAENPCQVRLASPGCRGGVSPAHRPAARLRIPFSNSLFQKSLPATHCESVFCEPDERSCNITQIESRLCPNRSKKRRRPYISFIRPRPHSQAWRSTLFIIALPPLTPVPTKREGPATLTPVRNEKGSARMSPAEKRRKNAAHGASRGFPRQNPQAPKGRKNT